MIDRRQRQMSIGDSSDRVGVTGAAIVDGTGDVILTWLENADPVTLFAAAGGGIDNWSDITDTPAFYTHLRAHATALTSYFVFCLKHKLI